MTLTLCFLINTQVKLVGEDKGEVLLLDTTYLPSSINSLTFPYKTVKLMCITHHIAA